MPPTKRERLERLVPELQALSAKADAKSATSEDQRCLGAMSSEVNQLIAALKAENPAIVAASGAAVLSAMSGSVDSPDYAAMTSNGGSTGPGFATKAVGSLGAPALDFTDEDVAVLQKGAQDRRITTKATTSSTESPMGAVSDYRLTPWPFLRDKPRILDLIPTENTTAPTVHYFRGTAAASAADAVAEGAAKPESSPVWEGIAAPVRKLAHYVRVNDEVIADFDQFRSVIGTEMLAGLIDAENAQLLNGTGVAPNLTGLLATTGITTRAKGTDTNLDALFKATNDLRTGTAFTEPDIIVMHPTDFGLVRLAKTTDGEYLTGEAMASGPVTLWGVPVVVTNRIAAGTALVANLKESARAYIRQTPTLEVAPVAGTAEFIANQTLIRAEERLALAVVRPSALVKVTGLAA